MNMTGIFVLCSDTEENTTRLKDFVSAGRDAQYTSPRIQNEIISACNELILERLVDSINRSKIFSFWLMKLPIYHVKSN